MVCIGGDIMTRTVVHVTTDSEVWKDVVGYEGLYQVSTFGRVKSLKRFDTRGNPLKSRILKKYKQRKWLFISPLM